MTDPDWPESPDAGDLGDGRFAHATDRPATIDDLAEVVRRRVGEGHALYPQGGRTALDHGGIPARPGVAIDLRGLNRVVDHPVADMTITVEAGITLAALQKILAAEGQRLDVEAPFADQATIGGVYATDTTGPRRFGYGRPRDQIIGVRYVNAEGQVIKGGGRVVKNVAGYDLPKLLTGSMGTLGIIAELTLKVRPMPEASALAWVTFAGFAEVAPCLDRLNVSATRPVALELLYEAGEWVLVVGFEGNAASVSWQVDRLSSDLAAAEFYINEDEDAASTWKFLVDGFAGFATPMSFEAHLTPSRAVGFLEGVDVSRWSVQAQAGNGLVRGISHGPFDLDSMTQKVDRLRSLATGLGGTLTLPRCPTDWKSRLKVWGDPRPDWPLAERVRLAMDPSGVLNPGRFLGTT